MKKPLFTLILLIAAISAFAQTINYGVMAGVNLSEQIHTNTYNFGHSFSLGANAGGILAIGFQNFSIEPGIFFSTKGENDASEYNDITPFDGGSQEPSKTKLYYIEVPVNFLYKCKIARTSFHFGGGPYIAYGFAESFSIGGQSFSDQPFDYKNPDFGINFVAGLTIKKFVIDASYGLGLANIDLTGANTRNSVISLSAGYFFR